MPDLTRDSLDAFFQALARRTPCRLKVILTGGAQALRLGGMGGTRPSRIPLC